MAGLFGLVRHQPLISHSMCVTAPPCTSRGRFMSLDVRNSIARYIECGTSDTSSVGLQIKAGETYKANASEKSGIIEKASEARSCVKRCTGGAVLLVKGRGHPRPFSRPFRLRNLPYHPFSCLCSLHLSSANSRMVTAFAKAARTSRNVFIGIAPPCEKAPPAHGLRW